LAFEATGQAADAELIQRRHRNEVFRVGAYGVLKVYAEDGERRAEATAMALTAFQVCEVRTPGLLALGRLKSGHRWTLEEWLSHAAPKIRTSAQHETQHRILGRGLRGLHMIRAESFASRLAEQPQSRGTDYFHRRLENAASRVAHGALPIQEVAAVVESVRRSASDDRCGWDTVRPTLVHGSYTGANAVAGMAHGKLIALFDFEEAHFGDPAEDLAWVAMYGVASPATLGMLAEYASGSLGDRVRRRTNLWSVVHALETLAWAPAAGDSAFAAVAKRRCAEALRTDIVGESLHGAGCGSGDSLKRMHLHYPEFAKCIDPDRLEYASRVADDLMEGGDEFGSSSVGSRGSSYRRAQLVASTRKVGINGLLAMFAPSEVAGRRSRILDALGGDGLIARIVQNDPLLIRERSVLTSDVSDDMVQAATMYGLPAMRQAAQCLALRSGTMDGVLLAYGTHHIPGPDRAATCAEALRVLRPGGRFVLHDFATGSPAARWFDDVVHRYSHTGHDYEHFDSDGLRLLLEGAGFEQVQVGPFYDPFVVVASTATEGRTRLGSYLLDMYGLDLLTEELGRELAISRTLELAENCFRYDGDVGADQVFACESPGSAYVECPRVALVASGIRPG
jgi:aminoglycoside phosphotransferase (APT) family kinase protein/SAM-dependent methyltransferase